MRWKDIVHWDLYSGGRGGQHTNINVYFKSQPVEVRQQRPDGTSSHVAGTGTAPGPQLTGRPALCPHQPRELLAGTAAGRVGCVHNMLTLGLTTPFLYAPFISTFGNTPDQTSLHLIPTQLHLHSNFP